MSVAEITTIRIEEIAAALRATGCSVAEVRDLVPGVTALLVGYSGYNIILMPPTDQNCLEDVDFRIGWRGRIAAVSKPDHALRAVFGATGLERDREENQAIEALEAAMNKVAEVLYKAEREHAGYKRAVLGALGVLRDVS